MGEMKIFWDKVKLSLLIFFFYYRSFEGYFLYRRKVILDGRFNTEEGIIRKYSGKYTNKFKGILILYNNYIRKYF